MRSELKRRAARLVGATLVVAAAGALPATASAASAFTCDASALRAQVLSAPAIEPVVANRGQVCKGSTVTARSLSGLPVPATVSALSAQTVFSGSDAMPGSQVAGAFGGVSDLSIGLPALPIALPVDQIPSALNLTVDLTTLPTLLGGLPTLPVSVALPVVPTPPVALPVGLPLPVGTPVPAVPAPPAGLPTLPAGLPALPSGLPALPTSLELPIADELKALAAKLAVPTELLGMRTAGSSAAASCVNGAPKLVGTSQAAGLRVLGQELPTDRALTQALQVIGGGFVDPSQLDAAALVAGNETLAPLGATVVPLVQQALDQLPAIEIPQALAQVTIKPAEQVLTATKLTQRALRVTVAVAGQQILDTVLGEASVSAANVPCTRSAVAGGPTDSSEAEIFESGVAGEQLRCTVRRLALVDVLRSGNRVRLFGVADRALVGRRVSIRFLATNAVVARPVVQPDGTFEATGPLPPKAIRDTNKARYLATVGSEKSLDLKLARRLVVSRLVSRNGRVTIAGRVIGPLASPPQTILVKRRVSCARDTVVARIKPSRSGAFEVTVDAPPQSLAATYRLTTKVRGTASNPRLFDTFTLPRAVEVR